MLKKDSLYFSASKLRFHRVLLQKCESVVVVLLDSREGPHIPAIGQQILIFAVISQRKGANFRLGQRRPDSHSTLKIALYESWVLSHPRRFGDSLPFLPRVESNRALPYRLVPFSSTRITHIPWITRENPFHRRRLLKISGHIILTDIPRLSLHYPEDVWCRITFFPEKRRRDVATARAVTYST